MADMLLHKNRPFSLRAGEEWDELCRIWDNCHDPLHNHYDIEGRLAFGFFIAERLSSAMNALGAEHAARSMIRDKRGHSL